MDYDALIDELSDSANIDEATLARAISTRFPSPVSTKKGNKLSKEEKISLIARHFTSIMEVLGLDLEDDSLKDTPLRIAKMYVEEVFSGLDPDTFPKISLFDDKFSHGQRSNMVFVKIGFCSFCEHHFVPMDGTACVAYIPNGKIIGLSKIPRIIRFFSRRPQVQERLAAQIADALSIVTGSDHIAVTLSAQHHCMTARGVECTDSHAITNVLRGDFDSDPLLRSEFFDAISRKNI